MWRRLNLNQRPGQARPGAIEKQPHAQRLGALHGHQPHLPANMVAILELPGERLVVAASFSSRAIRSSIVRRNRGLISKPSLAAQLVIMAGSSAMNP